MRSWKYVIYAGHHVACRSRKTMGEDVDKTGCRFAIPVVHGNVAGRHCSAGEACTSGAVWELMLM